MLPELRQRLASTDRGDLWTAQCDDRRSLVRMLDGRFVNAEFRDALDRLAAGIARRPSPRLLPIRHHDFAGDNYYIEYMSVSGYSVQSLPTHFARSAGHWLSRLQFVKELTEFYPDWTKVVGAPVGPHAGRVVACNVGGRWLAHLAPCPYIRMSSPCDVMSADPAVVASLSPERLRGVAVSGEMEDVYAAGSLVLQALGLLHPNAGNAESSRDARIEAQARGSSAGWDVENSEVERALRGLSRVRESIRALGEVVRRCTDFTPDARREGIRELGGALGEVLAFRDSVDATAKELDGRNRVAEALQLVEWALTLPGAAGFSQRALHELAANYCGRLRLPVRELQHIKALLVDQPSERTARRIMELHYDSYLAKTGIVTAENDKEGEQLLTELEELRQKWPQDRDEPESRAVIKEDLFRESMIHGRRGDLYKRALALYNLSELDVRDVDNLFLYALSQRDREDQTGDRATLDAVIQGALRRIDGLFVNGELDEEEKRIWVERFQSLRQY